MDAFNIRSLSGPKLRTLKLAVAVIVLMCTVLLLRPYTETAQTAMRCIQQSRVPGSEPEPESTPKVTSPLQELETVPANSRLTQTTTDWSKFAYVQYATVVDYLCNSVLIFASLNETDSKADRVLLYPDSWSADVSQSSSVQTRLLALARDEYNVILKPIKVQRKNSADCTSPIPTIVFLIVINTDGNHQQPGLRDIPNFLPGTRPSMSVSCILIQMQICYRFGPSPFLWLALWLTRQIVDGRTFPAPPIPNGGCKGILA